MDSEERDGIAAGEMYPLMPEKDRQRRLAELDRKIGHTSAVMGELSRQAGDMETVADEHGWLPSERRDLALTLFAARRVAEVRHSRIPRPITAARPAATSLSCVAAFWCR